MIPVIDFDHCRPNVQVTDAKLEETGKALVDVLSSTGFAYLTNHGISKELIENVREAADGIFTSPSIEKQKYARDPITNCGYIGLLTEKLDDGCPYEYKEAFHVASPALDPSIGMKWPHDLSPNFAALSRTFMEKCKALSLRILELIGIGLDLKDHSVLVDCQKLMHKSGNMSGLRILYYPSIPDHSEDEIIRLGEHSDWGSITLLFQDSVGGLQVNIDEKYVDAMPVDGALLLNVGDSLEMMSGGRIKSKKHRVLISDDEKHRKLVRRSMGYFVHPDNEVVMNQPLLYKGDPDVQEVVEDPITSQQYVIKKLAAAHRSKPAASY
uniref:Fe2OG dioxygenase domain-containing protein n=2 Tax=Ciona savignyi TaxID=51511 RepID=H2Y4W2_CIOSA